MENSINRLVPLRYLDIIPYKHEAAQSGQPPAGVNQPVPKKMGETTSAVGEPVVDREHYGDNWQEESPRKRLGYHTNISRQERWNILVQKALPQLGYQRVCEYLRRFIEDKSKIKHKDFSRAISVWKEDLQRLYDYQAIMLKRGS